jgi:hypothetical protein
MYPDTFNEYEVRPDLVGSSITYTYGPPIGLPRPAIVDDAAFTAACTADRQGKATPRPGQAAGVVWHDGSTFTKTIHLTGHRLEIHYTGAAPGHLVGNEFCLDVRAALADGPFLQHRSNPTPSSFALTNGHLHVTVTPQQGCRLTPTAYVHDATHADEQGITRDWHRLHRVLTDAVEIECPNGGNFTYSIDIANTPRDDAKR